MASFQNFYFNSDLEKVASSKSDDIPVFDTTLTYNIQESMGLPRGEYDENFTPEDAQENYKKLVKARGSVLGGFKGELPSTAVGAGVGAGYSMIRNRIKGSKNPFSTAVNVGTGMGIAPLVNARFQNNVRKELAGADEGHIELMDIPVHRSQEVHLGKSASDQAEDNFSYVNEFEPRKTSARDVLSGGLRAGIGGAVYSTGSKYLLGGRKRGSWKPKSLRGLTPNADDVAVSALTGMAVTPLSNRIANKNRLKELEQMDADRQNLMNIDRTMRIRGYE